MPRRSKWGGTVLAALLTAAAAVLPGTMAASASSRTIRPDIRLYVLDCGYIRTSHTETYGITPAEAGTTDMAVPCYLIRHGKDWLIFEAGIGDFHARRRDTVLDMTLELPKTLPPQLKAIGVTPAKLRYVALSHYHYDHVGNVSAFSSATLLIQRAEVQRMMTNPYPFSPAEAVARLKTGKVEQLDGDHDVFGDGTVLLVSTPGHSPGHQSMLVRLRGTGPVFLTGDLYHYPAERRLQRLPTHEVGNGVTPASRARFEAMAAREKARVWIEHDLDHFKTQRHAPAYYD